MKIFHVAPFGPNTCGIYEAARDMMRADILSGHEAYFVDRGNMIDGKLVFKPVGTVDDRGGFKIVTSSFKDMDEADVIIAHTMPHNEWLARNEVPVIFVVHGRPLYSFRREYSSKNTVSYTYINDIANYPRVKKMLYFWSEYKPFWFFPPEKDLVLDYPIIDQVRFSPKGEKHLIEDKHRGKYNILICDSWREDIDMFEIFNGAIQYARKFNDVKFHLYAVETEEGNRVKHCWDFMLKELTKLGAMGELCGRMPHMEKVYRSMDAVLTPHRIITRVIGESLSCGTPVIADSKCKLSQFGCDPHNPYDVSNAIRDFVNSNKKENIKNALKASKNLSIENYSEQMNKVYLEIKK